MTKKLFAAALFCALMSAFSLQTSAKARYPYLQNERFVARAMRVLHSAQVTYSATTGNGNYGTFAALGQANLIDSALASGIKYSYKFAVVKTDFTPNQPAAFYMTATPRLYRKTGRKSFYIDVFGEIRGADKGGAPATADDPIIEVENECLPNEECTISNMRTLHSAEVTYAATSGNGNYGSLSQLRAVYLINELLARGYANGYNFTITTVARTNNNEASFNVSAVPQIYGTTGIRSFYIDTSGVIYGADKHGEPANADDPPIQQ